MSTPIILAIDTAQEYCSVAILKDKVVAEKTVKVGNKHAEVLLDMISELLKQEQIEKKDVSFIAFGSGPGSFTGLRVACGVAQGMAWGLGIKVVPVSNLEALAFDACVTEKLNAGTQLVVMNDARMQQYYAQHFVVDEDCMITSVDEPAVLDPEEVDTFIKSDVEVLIGSAPFNEPELWQSSFSGKMIERNHVEASCIAKVALKKLQHSQVAMDPADVSPIYVRNKVAQTIAERRLAKQQK